MNFSLANVFSIGGTPIRSLAIPTVSVAMGPPDEFQSTLSADSAPEQRWTWTACGVSAVLNEKGSVTCLLIDPHLTHVVVHEERIPLTETLFLARFPEAKPTNGSGLNLTLGPWRLEVEFEPWDTGKTLRGKGPRMSLVTIRRDNPQRGAVAKRPRR